MKPHNQSAPGLGRTNNKLGALAKQYRRRIDTEMAKRGQERDTDNQSAGKRRSRAA